MIEIPGRIPIIIHPFFWVTAALLGWLNSGTLFGLFIWMGIIFFSILFHELGHAVTALFFRQKTSIQLVAFGGLTSYDGPKLSFWQQFIIVFNGPLFGFFIFLGATFLLHYPFSPLWMTILKMTQVANLFWSVVNLFPVLPLDGGQLLRIALEAAFGIKGYRASLFIGAIFSVLVALAFFMFQGFLIGALFFLFAFQSFDLWRKSKTTTIADRDESIRLLLVQGEASLAMGKLNEAAKVFSEVREKTASGLFYVTATQYLAFLYSQMGQKEEAYKLLLPLEEELTIEAKCILHTLAAAHHNWTLVAKLSSDCFQYAPSQEMALCNARAFAALQQAKFSGGWLQTAAMNGTLDIEKILKEEEFQAIQLEPDFQHFVKNL